MDKIIFFKSMKFCNMLNFKMHEICLKYVYICVCADLCVNRYKNKYKKYILFSKMCSSRVEDFQNFYLFLNI